MEEAERKLRNGDEENAFNLYLKYFNLVTIIQKSKDFGKYKSEHRKYLGTKDEINKRMDILEKLKKNLMIRLVHLRSKIA